MFSHTTHQFVRTADPVFSAIKILFHGKLATVPKSVQTASVQAVTSLYFL